MATARGRLGVVVVALAALAENVPYLGNHLAFTNAAVWPKREAFRLLTNANIDWGQNDEKIAGWLDERGLRGAAFNPYPRPSAARTSSTSTTSRAWARFRQHQWLREHVSPRAHLGHTYLWFSIDPATYERLIEESRPPPAVRDRRAAVRGGDACRVRSWTARPPPLPDLGRTEGLILCVTTPSRIDLGLIAEAGSVVLGPGGQPLREQSAARRRASSPGIASSPARARWPRSPSSGLRGRWALRGGAATLALRRVPVERGPIAEDPVSPP